MRYQTMEKFGRETKKILEKNYIFNKFMSMINKI